MTNSFTYYGWTVSQGASYFAKCGDRVIYSDNFGDLLFRIEKITGHSDF